MAAPLMPAAISLPVSNRQLLTDLDLLQRHFMRQFFQKYGNQNYSDFLTMEGGAKKVTVQGRDFYHHESRGKLHSKVTVNAQITAPAAGADVTVTITAGDHFRSGADSPLRVGEVVRVSTSGIEGKIVSVNKTTPSAHTATIRPLKSTQAFVSAGSANLAAGELLEFRGVTEAGERSTAPDPLINLTEKISNSTTEIRECWRETDRSLIETMEFDYEGQPFFKYKGMDETQRRFLNNKEFKLMFGDKADNLSAVGGSVGTQGVIPRAIAGGQTVNYTPGSFSISTLNDLTRAALFNGGPMDYHGLLDIYLRQEFDAELFSQYDAGAINWATAGGTQQIAIGYGFRGISLDGFSFLLKTYKPFSPEAVYGATPTTGLPQFRNFGLFLPQGQVSDPKSSSMVPNIRIVINTVEGEPEIKTWQTGAYAKPQPIGEVAEVAVHWITYQGIEMAAANQYLILSR